MTKLLTTLHFKSSFIKTNALFLLLFFLQEPATAQKELWGTVANGGEYGYGYLYKTDANGDNLQIVFSFKGLSGESPAGRLVSSGNGKLYGLTSSGGQPASGDGGVLYEYDMRTDSLHVLYYFKTTNPELPLEMPAAINGLTESAPGIFHGEAGSGRRTVFKFNANTNTMQLAFSVPNFTGGSGSTIQFNGINGPLFKASDGYLYGSTYAYSQCPIAFPNAGSVIRIHPVTNAFSLVYPYSCLGSEGWNPNGDFVQVGSKLYSTNAWGGLYGGGPTSPGNGTIFEYDPTTNTYTKKYDFDGPTGFRPSSGLTLADNGKLYGTTTGGGTPYGPYPNGSGVLFEFDPATGAFAKKYDFDELVYTPGSVGIFPNGTSLLKASNGKLYGQSNFGIYEYDVSTNTVRAASRYPAINPFYPSLIETCRPPAYKPFTDSVFTLCEGSVFHFDLHNSNSTSIIWKHNGSVSSADTFSILHFDAITLADAGTWECTLTNECGITQPYALHLTVNPALPGTVSSILTPADTSMICPGTSLTLSGNNGGTWNTGATSATIVTTQPGAYQVINTNACGNFYSNIVVVDTIPSPASITVSVPPTMICYGDPVTLSGNVPGGTWSNGDTGPTTVVTADSVSSHYVTLPHTCGTDTSNILVIPGYSFYVEDPLPVITAAGLTHFCSGDGVWLHSNKPSGSTWNWTWWKINPGSSSSYVSNSNSVYITSSGLYIISQNTPCDGTRYSDTIEVIVDMGPPPIPSIYTSSLTTFCEGGTAILETNATGGSWNNGETGLTTEISTSGTYFYTSTNACGSSPSTGITVNVIPAPVVTWTQSPNAFCVGSTPVSLSGNSPSGGNFFGPGVSGGVFNPSIAGSGTHIISYGYADPGTGCYDIVTQTIQVDSLPDKPILYNSLGPPTSEVTICEGDSLLIFPVPVVFGLWNTGATFPLLYVKEAGIYHFTITNGCGSTASDDFTLNVSPTPVINWPTLPESVCLTESPLSLATASPVGGTYSGTGVSGSSFDPAIAGEGSHTLTYSYSVTAGCEASAIQVITVNSIDSVHQSPTICVGETYYINGHAYTSAGFYTDTLQSTLTGCDSIVTTNLSIDILDTMVMQSGPELTAAAGYNYQWIDCNNADLPLPGENAQIFTASVNGNYAVVVSTPGSCSDTSACYLVTSVNVPTEVQQDHFTFYPNPAQDHLLIASSSAITTIKIMDPAGKTLINVRTSPVDISSLARGTYLLEVETRTGKHCERFVKL